MWQPASVRCLTIAVLLVIDGGTAFAQPDKAAEILRERCYHCHGENGIAESDVYVLDRERLIRDGVVIPGKPSKSRLFRQVESKKMPEDMDGLPAAEVEVLRAWIRTGAQPFDKNSRSQPRIFIKDTDITTKIRGDLLGQQERYWRYYRYFSIVHLYNANVPDDELEGYRLALAKLLNSLSWNRNIVNPTPIDGMRTIFRIDIRDYAWTEAMWWKLESAYPYGYLPAGSAAIEQGSGAMIPYVRADWFVAAASVPPLYHELLGLPTTALALEQKLGVDTARNLSEEKSVVRAGIRKSGVSKHNRIVERHASPFGAYWKSFDFSGSTSRQNIFRDPLHFREAGGEMVFNLPNGLQGYMIVDGKGLRLDEAPISIVSDVTNKNDPVVRNGRSCMACHFEGVKFAFKNDVHAMLSRLEKASFDLDGARALYQSDTVMQNYLRGDLARFRSAVKATGGTLSRRASTEPVRALSNKFQQDLPVALAAAEVGLTSQQLRARLRSSQKLIDLGLGQLLVTDGAIKRQVWESDFRQIATELGHTHRSSAEMAKAKFAPTLDTKMLIGKWSGHISSGRSQARRTRSRKNRERVDIEFQNGGVLMFRTKKSELERVSYQVERNDIRIGDGEKVLIMSDIEISGNQLTGTWSVDGAAKKNTDFKIKVDLQRTW